MFIYLPTIWVQNRQFIFVVVHCCAVILVSIPSSAKASPFIPSKVQLEFVDGDTLQRDCIDYLFCNSFVPLSVNGYTDVFDEFGPKAFGSVVVKLPVIAAYGKPMAAKDTGKIVDHAKLDWVIFDDFKYLFHEYGFLLMGPLWFFLGMVTGGTPSWSPFYRVQENYYDSDLYKKSKAQRPS